MLTLLDALLIVGWTVLTVATAVAAIAMLKPRR